MSENIVNGAMNLLQGHREKRFATEDTENTENVKCGRLGEKPNMERSEAESRVLAVPGACTTETLREPTTRET